jgi:CubicO group peptidase (beta-lactamase class C family)
MAGPPRESVATAQFKSIDEYVVKLFDRSRLPGVAVGIVRASGRAYFRGLGEARRGVPVGEDTLFVLGSTSKGFTALATLQLVDSGKVDLDAPVRRYLPDFLRGSLSAAQITVRSLLNQTSGLSEAAGDQPVWSVGKTGPNAIREWVEDLRPASLDRAVGRFEYSNANYVVLGALIETVSGQTYADYMREHVFLPLQMTDSHASMTDVGANRLALGHKKILGITYEADWPYPPAFVPAGFVITSARDVEKYLAAQLPGSPTAAELHLSAASLALWHEGVAAMDPKASKRYAMGWITGSFNGVSVVAHPGDTDVFSSEFVLAPGENWGVFVLADGCAWLSSQYLHEMASGIVSKLVGRTPRDDAVVHRIVLAIYLAVMAAPLLQLFALWKSRNRAGSWLRRCWPAALHVIAAVVLILIFPRLLFGMPFSELLWAFPDMGYAAISSGLLALVALTFAVRNSGNA